MAIKEIQTRIALRYDSYTAWTTAPGKDFVLLKGEIGICSVNAASQESNVVPTVLFKVGDGTKTFEQLPWASAKAADVYNWAKSETVVLDGTTIKFKTGNTVNHTIDLSSFATDAEVETIRQALDARVAAIEGSLGDNSDVGNAIDTIEDRLDVIEGTETGSIKKAVADAVTELKAYADTAETDAITAAETYTNTEVAKDRERLTAIEGVNSTQGAAIAANTSAIEKEVTDRTTAVSDEATARANADTAINEKIGGSYSKTATVHAAIEDAKKAGTDAAEAVSTLENGKVKNNTENIAKNATAIADVEADLAGEIARATGVEADFEERISTMEVFWDTTEDSDDVVNKLKEIQDYIKSDKTGAATMAGNIQANTQAITALQNIVKDGGTLEVRVDNAEADIDAVEGRADTLEAIVSGYDSTNTVKKAVDAVSVRAEKGITDAAAADEKAGAAQDTADAVKSAVENTTTGLAATKKIADDTASDLSALTTRVETAEGNITTIQGIVTGNDGNSKLRADITSLQTLTGDASKGNVKLRSDLDTLTGTVNDSTTGLAATKAIADQNKTDISDLKTDVAAIKADYLKAADSYIFNCGTATEVTYEKA